MIIKLRDKCFDYFFKVDSNDLFELKKCDFPNKAGKVEMRVRRGELFEKACISNIKSTVTIPGRDHQSTIECLGVQAFPKNPLVPIFNRVFENVSELGKKWYPGFFDIYPVVSFEEDEKYLKDKMGAVCQNHGRQKIIYAVSSLLLNLNKENMS